MWGMWRSPKSACTHDVKASKPRFCRTHHPTHQHTHTHTPTPLTSWVCDMTCSYVGRDSFIYDMTHMTHSYVGHDSFMYDMTHMTLQHTVHVLDVCCSVLKCAATHCKHPATPCNTLQHTATHCNTRPGRELCAKESCKSCHI